MMAKDQMKFEPIRPLDDFILESARFQLPDFTDLERWERRIQENLIYYQTNYLMMALMLFLIVGIFNPGQMLLGMTTVVVMVFGFIHLTKHQAMANNFKNNHPWVCFIAVFLFCYLIASVFGSVLVFIFGVLLPISVIFIHASTRLRNLKNKAANFKEKFSLKTTPMGVILDQLGLALESYTE